jgi:hypothetical protein
LPELTAEVAATADHYSGLPIPPDALAAKLGAPKDDRPPLVKALERAGAAIVSAQRDCADKMMLLELDGIAVILERLALHAAAASSHE